jgi:hypothetical protein
MSDSATMKISGFLGSLSSTLKSCCKLALQSRKSGVKPANRNGNPLIILGNGPSLRKNLQEDFSFLKSADTLAVNFAANSPEFFELQPTYYLLADPHFFDKALTDPNVGRLIENLNRIEFRMTLFVPTKARQKRSLFTNPNLTVETFNFVAVEGFEWFENWMFDAGRGMPRPRNVLIPSIMTGLRLGYDRVYLLGADHSWLQTLSVNDRNEVESIQPHFYKEDKKEEARVKAEYVHHPLHQVLESMMIAFRSYHRIQRYAEARGLKVLNATPGSMIDAFPREALPKGGN